MRRKEKLLHNATPTRSRATVILDAAPIRATTSQLGSLKLGQARREGGRRQPTSPSPASSLEHGEGPESPLSLARTSTTLPR
jgi:hypothetical protein